MNGITKAKCIFSFTTMKNEKEAKCNLELTDHYLSISLPTISTAGREIIRNIFSPLYISSNGSLNINYSLIKTIQLISESTAISFVVYNTVMKLDFCFTLKQFETTTLVFKKKMNPDNVNLLYLAIQQKVPKETKYLIQKIILLLTLLKDCIDPQKGENTDIETILYQSYMYGKAYYEKYTSIYKSNLKIKKTVKKQLNEKLKMLDSMISDQEHMKKNLSCACFDSLINELKGRTSNFLEESILLLFQILCVEKQIIDFKKIDKLAVTGNLKTLNDEYTSSHTHPNSFIINNKLKPPSHTKSKSRIKHYSPKLTDKDKRVNKTCNNIFNHSKGNINHIEQSNLSSGHTNIINMTKGLSLINNYNMNLFSDNPNISLSTKNTSKKKEQEQSSKKGYCINLNSADLLETPKFYTNTNIQYKYIKKQQDFGYSGKKAIEESGISMCEIMNQIEFLAKKHCFVPPTDVYNIFQNTSEIIHRKFFELCFEMFLGKIFAYEIDNDNLIKIDSLYNYFLYIRGVKNFLFIEKNKIYYSSMIFVGDDFK